MLADNSAHVYNPNTQETEAGGLPQFGLQSETLSYKTKNKEEELHLILEQYQLFSGPHSGYFYFSSDPYHTTLNHKTALNCHPVTSPELKMEQSRLHSPEPSL